MKSIDKNTDIENVEPDSLPDLSSLSSIIPRSLFPDIKSLVKLIADLKSQARPLQSQLDPIEADLKILNDSLYTILKPYLSDLPKNISVSSIPVSYVSGRSYIVESLLLEHGVPKSVVSECKKEGKGHFVVDRKNSKKESE